MPLSDAYGYRQLIELGVETTYGTAVASSRALRPSGSVGFHVEDEAKPLAQVNGYPVEFFYGQTGSANPREWKDLPKCEGTIPFEIDFTDFPLLLLLAIGGRNGTEYTVTGPTDTAAYTHTFRVPTSPAADMPPSLTVRHFTGLELFTYVGALIDTLEISAANGANLIGTVGLVARNDTPTTGASPTASISTAPLSHISQTQLRFNATTGVTTTGGDDKGNIQMWKFSIANALRKIGAGGTGGRYIRKPVYDGPRSFAFEFDTDYEATTWQNLWRALGSGGYGTLEQIVTSPTLIPGTAATPYSMRIRMPAARFLGNHAQYGGGYGVLPEKVRAVASTHLVGATPTIAEIQVVNGQSAAYIT